MLGTSIDFQESPFPGSEESDKKANCSSRKVHIITDESQQNLRWLYRKHMKWKKWIFRNIPPIEAKIHKKVTFIFQ